MERKISEVIIPEQPSAFLTFSSSTDRKVELKKETFVRPRYSCPVFNPVPRFIPPVIVIHVTEKLKMKNNESRGLRLITVRQWDRLKDSCWASLLVHVIFLDPM